MKMQFKRNVLSLAALAVSICLFVAAASMLPMREAEARQFGSYEPVNIYTFEGIVDESGGFGDTLPSNISGTIVGLTVFMLDPNQAWYPIMSDPGGDGDNIRIGYSFSRGENTREFGGYLRYDDTWEPIQEYIGRRVRFVVFVRND